MPKKPTVYDLHPKKKVPKVKEQKTLKEMLPVLIPVGLVLFLALIIVTIIGFAASSISSDDITVTGQGAPISAAEIVDAGFTDEVASDNKMPDDIDSVMPGDTFYSYCRIDGIDNIATKVAVVWTLPDGTMTGSDSLAVNRDGYYYSEIEATDTGKYTATWTVYKKDPVSYFIEVGEQASKPSDDEEDEKAMEGAADDEQFIEEDELVEGDDGAGTSSPDPETTPAPDSSESPEGTVEPGTTPETTPSTSEKNNGGATSNTGESSEGSAGGTGGTSSAGVSGEGSTGTVTAEGGTPTTSSQQAE